MRVRYHSDPDGEPHIHNHRVEAFEVVEALERPLERLGGRDESVVVVGRTRSGRLLRIIYVLARDGDGIFVVTAYDLPPKQVRALNRRLRRKPR